MHVVGLDIGGANIKLADNNGRAVSRSFELWKSPEKTGDAVQELLKTIGTPDLIAVTMTAELADCFETKAEGVDRILSEVERATASPIVVWQTGAEFVSPEVAREIPLLVAAANWHALATWLGRMATTGNALLVDIGSTTSDIIPLLDGVPVPAGMTDVERLRSSELVYTGVRRTPLCSLAHTVPLGDDQCSIAAEVFATTQDVYLVLGDIDEDASNRNTANGQPATIQQARNRLARMLCCDMTEVTLVELQQMASFLSEVQLRMLRGAVDRVTAKLTADMNTVIVTGSGQFLAERLIANHRKLSEAPMIRLSDIFNSETSDAACAMAICNLAAERVRVSR